MQHLIQWTWGLPQNILGLFLFIYLKYIKASSESFTYRHALVTKWQRSDSMGLGMFIFSGEEDPLSEKRLLDHEYGHTIQSMILGPFFLPMIAVPSLLWMHLPQSALYRRKKGCSYFDFYTERFADYLGGIDKKKKL